MFNFNPAPTFVAHVPLSVPGLPEPLEVDFTFKHKTKAASVTWLQAAGDKPDAAILQEVIADWGMRRDGEPVPYSLTALSELLENYPTANGEIFRAYLREVFEAKRKN